MEPTMLAEAFPANQKEWRDTCSLGVYHIPVMSEKPGEMPLSKTPNNVRNTIKLA